MSKTVYIIGDIDRAGFKRLMRWFPSDGMNLLSNEGILLFTAPTEEMIEFFYKQEQPCAARLFNHGLVVCLAQHLSGGRSARVEVARTLDRIVEILAGHANFYFEVAFTNAGYYNLRQRGRKVMYCTEFMDPCEVAA